MTHRTIHPGAWLPAKGCANEFLTEDNVLRNGSRLVGTPTWISRPTASTLGCGKP